MRTRTSFRVLSLSAALLALAGCRIEKPATVVPTAPLIDTFTVSAPRVDKGGMVTLRWKVSHATRIELREASSGALAVSQDLLEGSFDTTVDRDSLFVLVARGDGGSDARALSVALNDGGATELNFQALPPVVPGGQSTTLVWTAPGARAVTLSAGGQALDTGGQLTSGAVTVTPRFDTQYTLVADGQMRTLSVTVQPAVLTLEATPAAVEPGQAVTLRWTAAGADRVVVSSGARGQLAEVTTPAMIEAGTFSEPAPALPVGSFVTYQVTAFKGSAQLSKSVTVYVGSALEIVRLDAPPVAAAGLPYTVRWQTVGADTVVVLIDGAVVHQNATATDAAAGQYSFTSPPRDFSVELVASDARGSTRRQLAQVDAVGVPTALTLMANPTSSTAGAAVTLTWTCPEARRIRIVDADGVAVFSATGQRAEGGTIDVFPNASTTYTATADNLLGSAPVTAQAQVTVTGTPLTVVQNPRTALSGQMVNLSTSAMGAIFTGFPHSLVLPSTQSDFLDISATGTRVLESGGNVVAVDLPFSTLLWGSTQAGPLTVSRAGWIAWGASLTVNTSEFALPSLSAPRFVIAPYWDDLTLTANSAVFVQVVGDAPDQSLVVQWNRMQCGSTTNTEATFQARVHQNGQVSFHYQTMRLNSSPSFSIGVQDGTRSLAVRSTATPVTDSALYLFSPVSQAEVRVTRGSRWGGFVTVGNARTRISSDATAVSFPLDISVSEFMFRPDPLVPRGQYLEIVNRTAGALDLSGWVIASTTTASSFTIPSLTVPAGGVAVVGESTDPAENDDAGVQLQWGTLTFARDGGSISVGTPDASIALTYSGPADGGVGASVEVDPGPFVNSAGQATVLACTPTSTFGSLVPPQRGSPGSVASCFGYKVSSIPVHFVDLVDAGTVLVTTTGTLDSATATVLLADAGTAPAPTPFGVRQPVVTMSNDGWLFWGTTTTVNWTNKTAADSATAPAGVLAPFWDDLELAGGPMRVSAMLYKRFEANEDPLTPAPHWVFQWSHTSHYYGSNKGADDLNFEVKLFEDGAIEYHYGAMTSGTVENHGDGNSATVWVENLAGNVALFQSINQPLVRSNTAVRFTPAP